MLKEMIEYIVSLKEESMNIVKDEINGDIYIKGKANRIPFDHIDAINLNSLDSTVEYIKNCIDSERFNLPFIVDVTHQQVKVYSGLDDRLDREYLVNTKALLPNIQYDYFMDMEAFVVQLKTNFIETENLIKLIAIVSSITDEAKIEIEDDGFSTKVTQVNGTAIKKVNDIRINPIVNLQPFRTFGEVEQPSSRFLLRIRDGGKMALFEADGGMWKLQAQKNVVAYLKETLKEEIKSKKVVVIG